MLGIGFPKLIVLVALILLVWYGFKYVRRLEEVRQALRRAQDAARGGRGGAKKVVAEDMVKCPSCGAYVAARGATKCGRTDCPY
jgi:formate-dependent phosphoribosylglycinamide formyltransferase (GAR transformylase)